jgi:hypothetical protein
MLLALIGVQAAVAKPQPGVRTRRGFNLRAEQFTLFLVNRIACGINNLGEICVDPGNSPIGGGGFWPKGTPDQYIFNTGLQVAGIISKTAGFAWRQLRDRARRRLLRALGIFRPLAQDGGSSLVNYEYMGRAESTRILQCLLERRVRLDFVYTGGMSRSFNHRRQLRAMFNGTNFRGLVKVEHFPRLDHTQLLEADRRTLIDAIARQLSE